MLFTVGHSTHTEQEFVQLIKSAAVTHIVDVRTLPGSTKFAHFNEENMRLWLPEHGITYSRAADLGGLRGKTAGVAKESNALWRNASFHRYADYALTAPFAAALQNLLQAAAKENIAVMCAEAVWWRCHRRIIADYAIAARYDVRHIMPNGNLVAASLTPGAQVVERGNERGGSTMVTYPAETGPAETD